MVVRLVHFYAQSAVKFHFLIISFHLLILFLEYDKLKKEIFEKWGYKYLFFWESDILNNIEQIERNIYENIR